MDACVCGKLSSQAVACLQMTPPTMKASTIPEWGMNMISTPIFTGKIPGLLVVLPLFSHEHIPPSAEVPICLFAGFLFAAPNASYQKRGFNALCCLSMSFLMADAFLFLAGATRHGLREIMGYHGEIMGHQYCQARINRPWLIFIMGVHLQL